MAKNRVYWTVRDRLENELTSRGMFPEQATQVIEEAIPELESISEAGMKTRFAWNEPEEHYPESLYAILLVIVKPIALAWIDRNKPQAWFRPMFA